MGLPLVIACVVCVCVLLVAEARNMPVLKAVSKTSASTSFVLYGLVLWPGGPIGIAVALWGALALSMVGDLALLSSKPGPFRLGVLAFLAAHLAYIALFFQFGVAPIGVLIGGVCVVVTSGTVIGWLKRSAGGLEASIWAYVGVISLMVALAAGTLWLKPGLGGMGLCISAVVFYASDLAVARERFVQSSLLNRVVGLPLYFGARLGFVWSTVTRLAE